MTHDPVTVFVSDDPVEQSAIINVLAENGIQGILNANPVRDVIGLGPLGHNPAAGNASIEVAQDDAEKAETVIKDYLGDLQDQPAWDSRDVAWRDEPETDEDRVNEIQKSFNGRLIIGFFCLFFPVLAIGPMLALYQLRLAWKIAQNAACSLSGWLWFWLLGALALPLFIITLIWTLGLLAIMLGFDF